MNSTELCTHFGRCGGCAAQDIPYKEQVARKAEALRTLFAPFWGGPIDVMPSPVLWQYRNKIDPVFSPKRYETAPPPDFVRETVLGFKEKGRWSWPLDTSECRIGPAGVDRLFAAANAWHKPLGLSGFDTRRQEGFLRALLVRDAKRTGQRMVVLITSPGPLDTAPFVAAVRESFQADSIYRGIFSGGAEVATADELELLYGAPAIEESLVIREAPPRDTWADPVAAIAGLSNEDGRHLSFRISPLSFFQTNPLGAERLYGLIRAWVRRVAPDDLYDLFGGMGGIAFSCADLVRRVWSVENVAAASEDGRHNAAVNGIGNVEFITDEVKNYLRDRLTAGGFIGNAAVVLDPPRSGMHPKAIRRLVELRPTRVLYVSCNPKVLAGEMPSYLEAYRLEGVRAVDMFPHTPHVEVLAELVARDDGPMA
jgi:23S rRNA (uracil1939-C5)-methyltransferase